MGIEKLPIGKIFQSPGRTVGEGEFAALQSLTWNTDPIHQDKEYMKTTRYGERVMVGACVLCLAWGLEGRTGFVEEITKHFKTMVAVEYEDVHFSHPVQPGDTLTVRTQLKEVNPTTKNPKKLVVKRQINAYNQRNEEVARATVTSLAELKEG